ncbi:MAG: esterase [Proteobacteria bacterium]|nr:esterase [Pseudomonadota bacterium]
MTTNTLKQIETALVPSPRKYRILLPEGEHSDLPLLLLLHGGEGSSDFLTQMQPLIEQAWKDESLPTMAVATLDAERSFYLDYEDGRQSWETFIVSEWLPHLRQILPVGSSQEKTLIAGISMGGHGTTRIAMKHPNLFHAMAAMEPAIMPGLTLSEIPERNLEFQKTALAERYGEPADKHWNANNPSQLAIDNSDLIKSSGIKIYLEVGTDDFLLLNEGTEFFHQILLQAKIKHEYRLVLGANHVGNSIAPRFLDMLGFLGRTLVEPQPDPWLDQILEAMKDR